MFDRFVFMCGETLGRLTKGRLRAPMHYVDEREMGRCAYVSIRQHTSAYVSVCQLTPAYVSIRQHTSAYVSIRRLTKGRLRAPLHYVDEREMGRYADVC